MIRIICGGKKSSGWIFEGVNEFEKRLKKPFDVKWEILEEEKLNKMLEKWPFSFERFVILADERGKNLSSPEISEIFSEKFVEGREIVIIIGGAFGVTPEVREKADLIWSFSRLVFPHMLMRVMLVEQIYRAQEIENGGKYHHF